MIKKAHVGTRVRDIHMYVRAARHRACITQFYPSAWLMPDLWAAVAG